MKYVDETGMVVAAYVYDDFGRAISQFGSLADVFHHRFSTKYFDVETGLYYYGYRFYSLVLRCWLTRDPLSENGGLRLYGFCANNPISSYDEDGRAYFALRKLKGFVWIPGLSHNPLFDLLNIEVAHELVFLEDSETPSDFGFSAHGVGQELKEDLNSMIYYVTDTGYNDCVMRKAIKLVPFKGHSYSIFWGVSNLVKCNCQDYATALRLKYSELLSDKAVRCECGLGQRNQYRRVDSHRGGKTIYE